MNCHDCRIRVHPDLLTAQYWLDWRVSTTPPPPPHYTPTHTLALLLPTQYQIIVRSVACPTHTSKLVYWCAETSPPLPWRWACAVLMLGRRRRRRRNIRTAQGQKTDRVPNTIHAQCCFNVGPALQLLCYSENDFGHWRTKSMQATPIYGGGPGGVYNFSEWKAKPFPENTSCWINVGLMLDQRSRRWTRHTVPHNFTSYDIFLGQFGEHETSILWRHIS